MDFIDFVCPVLRTPYVELFFTVVAYFGHASVGGIVGLLLLAHGYFYNNPRTRRTGISVLLALLVAGLAAEFLNALIQLPKPKMGTSNGTISGHTSAAFALASVLSAAFPPLGPFACLLAVMTALSRSYFRAHYAWNVAGGAVMGLLIGLPFAKYLIAPPRAAGGGPLRYVAWLCVVAFGVAGLVFFNHIDRLIRSHLVENSAAEEAPVLATIDFGTPPVRTFFQFGWSEDEKWLDGKLSVVWAHGLGSALTIELPAAQDYRFRLRIYPYAPKGLACQHVDIRLNNTKVAKLFLERGWRSYDIKVPRIASRAGNNDLQFFYNYAESPKSRLRSPDERDLSVAFDKLEVYIASKP